MVVRPRALADLADIWAYIAEDSEDQADTFADRINAVLHELSRHPGMGRRRPELLEGIRSFPCGNYLIFYFARPRGLEVVRVLHGSRDLPPLLDEEAD